MPSYISLQKQINEIVTELQGQGFSKYTNHLLSKEDKIFLDKKILTIEKIIEKIDSLNVGKGKVDRHVMKYIKAFLLFSLFKDVYIALDFAGEYCLQKIRDTNPRGLKKLEKILQSPETWSVRILPKDILTLLLPKMSPPVRKIAHTILQEEKNSWKTSVEFDINSFRNAMNTLIIPHKKNIIKRIGLWLASQKIKRKNSGLITEDTIKKILPKLEAGDILLTRGNWNLTNNGIPGFWKHMSLYIGNEEICEAVGTGIQQVNIRHLLLKNDYCVVLRTKFTSSKRQEAISYVLSQIGKTYDFTFNYYCDSAAVCSALVTKAYLPNDKNSEGLNIDLVWTNGAYTYPPNNLIKKMDKELDTEKEQVIPVVFIDTIEKKLTTIIRPGIDARKTWKRSRWDLFQK